MPQKIKIATIALAVLALGLAIFVWQAATGFSATLNFFEGLSLSAPTTTLHVGESTRLTVEKKRGLFLHAKIEPPDAVTYLTVSESDARGRA